MDTEGVNDVETDENVQKESETEQEKLDSEEADVTKTPEGGKDETTDDQLEIEQESGTDKQLDDSGRHDTEPWNHVTIRLKFIKPSRMNFRNCFNIWKYSTPIREMDKVGIWAASWQNKKKWHVRAVKIRISLPIRLVYSESSLSAWRNLGSLASHWAHSEDWSDWADAQADLSLCWGQRSFNWFCHEVAQF